MVKLRDVTIRRNHGVPYRGPQSFTKDITRLQVEEVCGGSISRDIVNVVNEEKGVSPKVYMRYERTDVRLRVRKVYKRTVLYQKVCNEV